jgi:hypothetical protein
MLKHYPVTNPTLGLNTKYRELNLIVIMRPCLTMTLIVFVPQPTPNQCSHSEKSWFVGSIGEKVSSTVYGRTVDKDTGKETNKMHLAFILVN